MANYDKIRKFLMRQNNTQETLDSLKLIWENENCSSCMVLNAYHLGVINGKRAERQKRKKVGMRKDEYYAKVKGNGGAKAGQVI